MEPFYENLAIAGTGSMWGVCLCSWLFVVWCVVEMNMNPPKKKTKKPRAFSVKAAASKTKFKPAEKFARMKLRSGRVLHEPKQ